jgi:hypothetical protein
MDKTITLESNHIEAWGLWWITWQKQTKERLRKHKMSPQAFVDKHLVSSESEGFRGDTTGGNTLLPK